MSDSREDSPDWLSSFQAPKGTFLTLSSDSDHSPTNSRIAEDDNKHGEPTVTKVPLSKNQDTVLIESGEDSPISKPPKSKSLNTKAKTETRKRKGNGIKEDPMNVDVLEKPAEPHVSSRLPLLMSEKVQRSKALVECEGDSIDMSGDVGAVGRVVIADAASGDPEMLLDLKGTIYKTTIVTSRTFCVVSFNQAEAKIEAIMNDFIQLKPVSNVYEAETMIEGTLDGFSFDSDEETDKISKPNAQQSDQNNEGAETTNGKIKGKTNKALRVTQKKGNAVGKPPKKGQRKTQGPKKARKAKK